MSATSSAVCHGCQDVTRRQVEALEAELAQARAEVVRLRDGWSTATTAHAEEVARLHEHIAYHLRDFRPGADDKASGDLAVDMGAYADRMKAELAQARAALARVEALADDMDERGRPGADDSARDAADRRQIREDAKRLRAALTPTTGTEQPS